MCTRHDGTAIRLVPPRSHPWRGCSSILFCRHHISKLLHCCNGTVEGDLISQSYSPAYHRMIESRLSQIENGSVLAGRYRLDRCGVESSKGLGSVGPRSSQLIQKPAEIENIPNQERCCEMNFLSIALPFTLVAMIQATVVPLSTEEGMRGPLVLRVSY